jgi:hypothetical protein
VKLVWRTRVSFDSQFTVHSLSVFPEAWRVWDQPSEHLWVAVSASTIGTNASSPRRGVVIL